MTDREFEKLIKDNFKSIRKMCSKYVPDPDACSLLFSQVLEKVWNRRSSYIHNDLSGFLGWCYVVIYHEFIDTYRSGKKFVSSGVDIISNNIASSENTVNSIHDRDLLKDITYTVENCFSEKYINVFRLHFIDGEKIKDVAAAMSIPENSVKTIIFRIREFLSNKKNIIKFGSSVPDHVMKKGKQKFGN